MEFSRVDLDPVTFDHSVDRIVQTAKVSLNVDFQRFVSLVLCPVIADL